MNNKQKFLNFLESIKGNGHDVLVESISTGFEAIFEEESSDPDLEHVIGNYYYDSKEGQYYDKSSDMYVESSVVDDMMNARGDASRLNNTVAGMLFKKDLINGSEYQKLLGRMSWPESIMRGVYKRAKDAGISISELFEKAKDS